MVPKVEIHARRRYEKANEWDPSKTVRRTLGTWPRLGVQFWVTVYVSLNPILQCVAAQFVVMTEQKETLIHLG